MAYNYGNNIGYLGNTPGIQLVYNNIKRNQVYQATHNSNDERTSYNARSYISFSFGGTQIEDLNLIACVDGDRMEMQLTANFHDLTSSYDVVDGQFYWGTYYDNNQMNFYLATDGMTQENLEDFIRLFAPGSTRELILAEHPNRAIMARVAASPTINMIPFRETENLKINTIEREVTTVLYKGDIQLELITEEPFWYAKVNVLGEKVDDQYLGIKIWASNWIDTNNNNTVVYNDEDGLRIIYEDRIPTLAMLRAPCILGNDLIYRYNTQSARVDYALIAAHDPLGTQEDGAVVGETRTAIEEMSNSMSLNHGESVYLYYSGTAPEKPIIKFVTSGTINTFLNQEISIDFICQDSQKLQLKIPLIYQQYKQIRDAFNNWRKERDTYNDMRLFIRSNITHPIIRKWSLLVVNYCSIYNIKLNESGVNYLFNIFNSSNDGTIHADSKEINKYYLNFQTGEMIGNFDIEF